MEVKQLYTNCLAQGAYYIAHNGEAAIIDPLRETAPYLQMLKDNGDTLKYIFETHFHADFVSGHVDLAKATGATIVFGPTAQTAYNSRIASDHETFTIGGLTLEVLHTPGHTLESSCFLLKNEAHEPVCVFTGDTLFIGDVGRPDLAIKSDLTQEDLAGMLYDSLRNQLMTLPDEVIVYPAHGAGSACGKNMSKETFDTLGHQKEVNYALQPLTKEAFVKELTTGILPAPGYFALNAAMNKTGYTNIDAVMAAGLKALSVENFEALSRAESTIVLDVRKPGDFAAGHVPGALFIGIDGQFAPWVGSVIKDIRTKLLLITPEGREEETVKRLARVGYDHTIGYLKGGFAAWEQAGKKITSVESITAEVFATRYATAEKILDVRKPGEFEVGHLQAAESRPLDFIEEWLPVQPQHLHVTLHCAGGYRSMIAASVLLRNGFTRLTDVQGGYGAISKAASLQPYLVAERTACAN
jgi:glyoxylase-like metal-dependent hydrolase (beta-lactamase superfamily II)/rhodanese-related sulfurtransferase